MSDTTVNTEAKIIEAATNEFMTKGYAGARTTSIAETAGVTHGMLHYYFRTKDKLFERIISEKIEMLISIITDTVATSGNDIFELLRNIIDRHLDFLAANPLLPGFLIHEIQERPESKELFIKYLKSDLTLMLCNVQAMIDRNAAEGKCRKIDSRQLMLDMACLNILPFMATPILSSLLPEVATISKEFVELRKQQNYETLANKLRL